MRKVDSKYSKGHASDAYLKSESFIIRNNNYAIELLSVKRKRHEPHHLATYYDLRVFIAVYLRMA